MHVVTQQQFELHFDTATKRLTHQWLTYTHQPRPALLTAFRQAQSNLYLAQVLGLEGNYAHALATLNSCTHAR